MTSAEKPSLYERLGGVYSIATVVDDLIDRVMVDPRLNARMTRESSSGRGAPSSAACGIQILGDRDGVLGQRSVGEHPAISGSPFDHRGCRDLC
jgi:hypothetical protein